MLTHLVHPVQQTVFEGDAGQLQYTIRRYGVPGGALDLSGADQIVFRGRLQGAHDGGANAIIVDCEEDTPGAAWATGVVAVPFTADDVAAAVGSVAAAIEMTTGTNVVTVDVGVVHVLDKPSFP